MAFSKNLDNFSSQPMKIGEYFWENIYPCFRLRDCELWAVSHAVASELGLFPSQDFSTEPNFTPSTRGMRNSRIYQIYRLG